MVSVNFANDDNILLEYQCQFVFKNRQCDGEGTHKGHKDNKAI
jgi:hypothetical protein